MEDRVTLAPRVDEGFPTWFIVAGANEPSALANFIILNEQEVEWACACIEYMRANRIATIEPRAEAEQSWMDNLSQIASKCLMPKANTWHTGSNIVGKPRTFGIYMGALSKSFETCANAAATSYSDFVLDQPDGAVSR